MDSNIYIAHAHRDSVSSVTVLIKDILKLGSITPQKISKDFEWL